jgi:hypothetical protein
MRIAVSADDVVRFADTVGKLSPLGAALVAIILLVVVFYRKWLVVGPIYSDLEARLEKTEQQREDALDLAAKLTGILEAGRRGSYRGR